MFVNMKFKFLLLIIISIYFTEANSSKYNYNTQGIGIANTKTMTLNDNLKYLLYENSIGWTDNLGNYGKSFCFGRIKLKKEIAEEFNLICESTDQNGYKSWSEFKREDTTLKAGSGNSVYIDGTGIYKDFIGSKCIFSTNYLDDTLFFKSKCKIKSEIIEQFGRNN